MEKLQRKETLDDRRVKNPEGEEAPQGQQMYNDGQNLKRRTLETTKLGGGYRRCSAQSSWV